MTSAAAAGAPATRSQRLLDRLGVPRVRGNANFVVANAIDSLGNGLLLAFQVVYFAKTTTLSLTAVGASLTLAQLLAMPVPVPVGVLMDRIGARAVAVIGNTVSAIGFVGFLFAHSPWQIVCVALVTQIGSTMYWTSSSGLVVLAAAGQERIRWFGFIRALRNIGVGAGGALGALAVGIGGTAGLRGVVVANVVSFVIAVWLQATWQPSDEARERAEQDAAAAPAEAAPEARGGYLTVLRDGAYLRLVAVNLSWVFAAMVLGVLLAAYVEYGLGRGAWIAGTLIVVNTWLVAVTQTTTSKVIERHRPTRVIAVACALNAAGFALFGATDVLPGSLVVAGLVVAMVVYTAAENVGVTPVNELSVALAPPPLRGRYLAVYQMSWTLGGALSPWLLTALLSRGPIWPWAFLTVLSLLAVPLSLSLERRMPAATPASEAAEAAEAAAQPSEPPEPARVPAPARAPEGELLG